ncbi:hypothetical protein STRDD11_02266 [Streptococcus sp. DD11]|nr:hypothetical protein STRDD11_02266 [Streptococcus sp. DD11]
MVLILGTGKLPAVIVQVKAKEISQLQQSLPHLTHYLLFSSCKIAVLVAVEEGLLQPDFRIAGRLQKAVNAVNLLAKASNILAPAGKILDQTAERFFFLTVIIAVKELLKNFILQNQLLAGILQNPKMRSQAQQITVLTEELLRERVHGADVSIGQICQLPGQVAAEPVIVTLSQTLLQLAFQPLSQLSGRLDRKGRDKELADRHSAGNLIQYPLDHDKGLARTG